MSQDILTAEILKVQVSGIAEVFAGKMLNTSPVRVMLDPGHGDQYISKKTGKLIAGIDPGSIATDKKTFEKDVVVNICQSIKKYLDAFNIDADMTRTGDQLNAGEKLEWRIQKALDTAADYFLCIHADASAKPNTATGSSIYYCKGDSKQQAFAQAIYDEMTLFSKRGIKDDTQSQHPTLYVLQRYHEEKKEGAALVEIGFVNNDKDLKIMLEQHNRIGEEIATGIYKHIFKRAPPVVNNVSPAMPVEEQPVPPTDSTAGSVQD